MSTQLRNNDTGAYIPYKKTEKYKDYTAKKEQHKDSTQKRKNRQSKDATGLSHSSNQSILFIKNIEQ